MKNILKVHFKKIFSIMLIMAMMLTNISGVITVYAAPTLTINPKAVSGSVSKRITVTSTEGSFTNGEATPYIMKNGEVESSASISSVNSTTNEVSFTLGAGLLDGDYDIRIVDPKGTYNAGSITIGDASISGISPSSISKDYTNQNIVITGVNTNFTTGLTSVEILNSNNDVVDYVDSITEVSNNLNLTLRLKDGLSSGTYSLRASTDDEIVTIQDVLEVRGNATATISPTNVNEGYSTTTINVAGSNTGFDQSQTTVNIIGENAVGTVNVTDDSNLVFSLNSGLAPGSYLVEIRTGSEVIQKTLTINSAAAQIKYQESDFSEVPVGYSSYNLVMAGINTSFENGTTQLSLFDGDPDNGGNDITSTYISNISVSNSTSISFQIGAGLDAGTYYIRAVTLNQIVEDTFTVVAPTLTDVSFNSNVVSQNDVPLGYKKMTVDIVGQNTLFQQGETTVEIQEHSDKTETVVVSDTANLSFSLKEGLTTGNYTILIDVDGDGNTSSDQINHQFTVTSPSIESVSVDNIINSSSTPKTITITSENTHFTSVVPDVKIIDNQSNVVNEAQITNITVISDTKLNFDLIPSSLSVEGSYGVKITTTSNSLTEIVTQASAFIIDSSGIDINRSFVYSDELGSLKIVVAGFNTNFVDGNTTVTIDDNEVNNVTVNSTINLDFILPEGLADGTHIIKVIDGDSNEFTSSIVTDTRTVTISHDEADYGYDSFKITVTADGLTFNTTDRRPAVNITGYGEVVVNDNEINNTEFTFDFPQGLNAGNHTITITWNGLSFENIFTINEVEESTPPEGNTGGDNNGGDFSGGGELEIDEPVIEDEVIEKIETEKNFDGKLGKEITFDTNKTIEAIETLSNNNFNILADDVSNVGVKLSSEIITALKEKSENMSITIKSQGAEYVLPTEVIDLEEIKASLGSEDVNLEIIIKEPTKQIIDKMNDVINDSNMKLLSTPIEFKIEASDLSGKNKIEVNNFKTKYVSRKIILNNNIDVNKAIGVKFDESKNMYVHVPTKFYKDENGNNVAQLKKKGNSIYTVIEKQKTFEDTINHWAKDNVEILASKLVVNGINDTQFAPNNKITRAEFAALLVRSLGLENSNNDSSFTDISGNEWFASVVSTAANEGLVTGYADGSFKPNKTINREEMAIMVVRALKVAEKNTILHDTEKSTLLSKFTDKASISNWAEKEVALAVKEGIIKGKTSNTFVPKDNATRAEAATMLIRMMKAVDFIN